MPQTEFSETLEWQTDIIKTKAGEQRIATRQYPRHGLTYSHILDPIDYARAQGLAAAFGWTGIAVPLWADRRVAGSVPAGATSVSVSSGNAEFVVGGWAVLWGSSEKAEALKIASVGTNSISFESATSFAYPMALVCPAKICTLSQALDGTRTSFDQIQVRAYFQTTDASGIGTISSGSGYPVFEEYDVMNDPPVLISSLRETINRNVDVIDSSLGPIDKLLLANYPDSTWQMGWSFLTSSELWRMKQWLYARFGRQRGFWMPTWNQDLHIVGTISPASNTATILSIGYAADEYREAFQDRRIRVTLTSGGEHYLKIIGAEQASSGTERITFSDAPSFTASASQIARIDFLDFTRLDTDKIEIKHKHAGRSEIMANVMRIPVP